MYLSQDVSSSIGQILDACKVDDTSIIEAITFKIKSLYALHECNNFDFHWKNDTLGENVISKAPDDLEDNFSNAANRVVLTVWWRRYAAFFLLIPIFFSIVAGLTFVLSFPRSQTQVWKGEGLFPKIVIAALGASVALAALSFCLIAATDLFKIFLFGNVSKYMYIAIPLQRVHCLWGVIVIVGSVVHSMAWFPLYWNLAHTPGWVNYDPMYESIGSLGARTRTFKGLCSSYVSITGYCMLGLLFGGLVLPSRALRNKLEEYGIFKGFSFFQYSHWIMAAGFVCLLLVHPMPTLPSFNPREGFGSISWIFLLIPMLIMIVSLALRFYRKLTSASKILHLRCLPGSAVQMIVAAPQGRAWKPGAFVQCRIPSISKYEWHPFSIASINNQSEITLYIKCSGAWTRQLYDQISGGQLVSQACHIDGPYATGTRDYQHYRDILLIAGGIGVTPFISIIHDITENKRDNFNSVTLHWVVRDISTIHSWFADLFERIEQMEDMSCIEVKIWFTGLHNNTVALCRLVGCMYSDVCNKDLISGVHIRSSRVTSHFGRPNLPSVFSEIFAARKGNDTLGVFSCGPSSLVASLRETCNHFSYTLGYNLAFHSEEFHRI